MIFEPTALPDVIRVTPRLHRDARGFFLESYHAERFAQAGIAAVFVQDNHSLSARGTLRGLHMQNHFAQGKLVRCTAGAIYDVQRGALLREGRVRIVAGSVPSVQLGALASFLLTGQPSPGVTAVSTTPVTVVAPPSSPAVLGFSETAPVRYTR